MRFQTAHTPNSLTEGPIAQTLIAFALPLFLGNLFYTCNQISVLCCFFIFLPCFWEFCNTSFFK